MRRMLTAAAVGAAVVAAAPAASAATGAPDLSLSIARQTCTVTVTNVGSAPATGVALYQASAAGRVSEFPTTLAPGAVGTYRVFDCPPGSPYPNISRRHDEQRRRQPVRQRGAAHLTPTRRRAAPTRRFLLPDRDFRLQDRRFPVPDRRRVR